jgi:preprotein translocase subunit SecA
MSSFISFISFLFGLFIKDSIALLTKELENLSLLSNEDFIKKVNSREFYSDSKLTSKITAFFINIFLGVDQEIVNDLALGIDAFRRCPADLPYNSELYPEQIKASVVLTQLAVLQMDTGEGKTYTLLPAAFALKRKFGRVYILCANNYLAFRDARRTKNYWEYVGLSVDYCGSDTWNNDEKWSSDVIYTTLEIIAFKSLKDDLNGCNQSVELQYGAIIIDEIDAVLLNPEQTYKIVSSVKSSIFDWKQAFDYIEHSLDTEHIKIDWKHNIAQLTVEGVESLRFLNKDICEDRFARMRKAIEISYMAFNLKENHDYVIKNERIVPVSNLTGELEYGKPYDWIIPLSIKKGLNVPNTTISLHQLDTNIFLSQFKHLSGMSGTAQEDMAEYLFSYKLPTVKIPPRTKRLNGLENDEVYKTRNGAIINLCEQAIDAVIKRRPVLIGTQSIKDAKQVYDLFIVKYNEKIEQFNHNLKINLVKGDDLSNIADIYEKGGEINSVIIATQIAGRGVDIRLSDEARGNGGIALFALERSLTIRTDKQFLGRVGRQGDPYSAKYFVSFESDLLKIFNAHKVEPMLNALKIEEDVAIKNSLLTKTISDSQKKYRNHQFIQKTTHIFITNSENEIWLSYRKLLHELNKSRNLYNEISDNYISNLTYTFVNSRLDKLIKKQMNSMQAKNLLTELKKILPFVTFDINSASFEMKTKNHVIKIITNIIKNEILDFNKSIKSQIDQFKFANAFLNIYFKIKNRENINSFSYEEDFQELASLNSISEHEINFQQKFPMVQNLIIGDFISEKEIEDINIFLSFIKEHYQNISLDSYNDSMDWFKNQFDNAAVIYKNCKPYYLRNQYEIIYWTIVSAFIDFNSLKDDLRQELRMKNLTTNDFQRLFAKGISDLWWTIHDELPTIIIENLLQERQYLDKLFIWEDNKAKSEKYRDDDVYDKKWDEIIKKNNKIRTNMKVISEYIDEYILIFSRELNFDDKYTIESLKFLLSEFFIRNSIESMRTSEGILNAFQKWRSQEEMHSSPEQIRKKNFKNIKKFISFLSEKDIVGDLPNIGHRVSASKKIFIDNFRDMKFTISVGSLVISLIVFVFLSIFGDFLPPVSSIPFQGFELLDNAFFFGMLRRGIITAPIFLLVLMGRADNLTLGLISSVIASFLFTSVTLTLNDSNFYLIVLALSVFYFTFSSILKKIELLIKLPISSLWIMICFLFLVFPYLLEAGFITIASIISLVIYYSFAHDKISRKKINVNSIRIKGGVSLTSQETQSVRYLNGYTRSIPHIMGLAFSYTIFVISENDGGDFDTRFLLSFISYLSVMSFIIFKRLHLRFPIKSVTEEIVLSGIIIEGNFNIKKSIEDFMRKARSFLVFKEIFINSTIMMILSLLLKDYTIPTTTIPLCFVVAPISLVFVENSKQFIKQFYNLFLVYRTNNIYSFEFEDVKASKDDFTKKQKLLHLINPTTSLKKLIAFLFLILTIVANIDNGIDAIYRFIILIFGNNP